MLSEPLGGGERGWMQLAINQTSTAARSHRSPSLARVGSATPVEHPRPVLPLGGYSRLVLEKP